MKLRAPLWAFPRSWRERHGREIGEMFVSQGYVFSDWLDIVANGFRTRLEESMRSLVVGALTVLAGVSLVAFGYAIAEVNGGVLSVHRHWWSTAPIATFALSFITIMLLVQPRRLPRLRV